MESQSARQSERVDYDGEVEFHLHNHPHTEAQKVRGRSINLSEGGMLVDAPIAASVGDGITCTLDLDGRPTTLRGRVAWARPESAPLTGRGGAIGVRFDTLSDEDFGVIRHVVQRAAGAQRPAEVHIEGVREPVPARARRLSAGVRLSVPLPFLSRNRELGFRLDAEGPLFAGRVTNTELRDDDEEGPLLEVDVEVLEQEGTRFRKHTRYGYAPEIEDAASPKATPQRGDRRPRTTASVVRGVPWLSVLGAAIASSLATAAVLAPRAEDDLPAAAGAIDRAAKAPRDPAGDPTPRQAQRDRDALAAKGTAASETENERGTIPGSAPVTDLESAAPAGVRVQVEGIRTRVRIPFLGSLEGVRGRKWADPPALALELPLGELVMDPGTHWVRRGGVRYVRAVNEADATKVHLLLSAPITNYHLSQSGTDLEVTLLRAPDATRDEDLSEGAASNAATAPKEGTVKRGTAKRAALRRSGEAASAAGPNAESNRSPLAPAANERPIPQGMGMPVMPPNATTPSVAEQGTD